MVNNTTKPFWMASRIALNAKKEAVKDRLQEIRSKQIGATQAGQNFDYWVAGSEEISPTSARDDGRFIYLAFNNNRNMTAIYSVDEGGNQALINTNVIDGNTIIVQRLVKHLMLRK